MVIFRENGLRTFKILKFELKTSKNESRKFNIFQTNQYGKQNRKSMYSIYQLELMRYEIFQRQVSLYSIIHEIREQNIQLLSSTFYKSEQTMHTRMQLNIS